MNGINLEDKDLAIDDDFLNLRFDPKFKQIYKDKIESQSTISIEKDYQVPISFKGDFSNKTKTLFKNLVNRVIELAGYYRLNLRTLEPKIAFYTPDSWGHINGKTYNLPASKIIWNNIQPTIQVVTYPNIDSSEVLIKTVRLLFSKVFGSMFFNEYVPYRKPYKISTEKPTLADFDLSEKLHFCRLADNYSQELLGELSSYAINKSLGKEKVIKSGIREFYHRIESEPENPNPKENGLLDQIFSFHLDSSQSDTSVFFNFVSNKIEENLPKLGLVLPHEMKLFRKLKNRLQWEYFDSIKEKAQFMVNCLNDLEDSFQYLSDLADENLSDYSTYDYWIEVLNSRMSHLKKKGLVKLFLIEGSLLTPKQKKEQYGFPLWIWKNKLFEFYPKKLSSEKIIQFISNQYKNSIYQKLFEAFFRAINCYKLLQNDTISIKKTSDFVRLNSLVAGIKIREPILKDILYSSRIAYQMTGINPIHFEDLEGISKAFEKGWSYFISFALIHQYYLEIQTTDKKYADRFLAAINGHVMQQLPNQASIQIAFLLIQIYVQEKFQLGSTINIIKKGSDAFDFFILNRKKILQRAETPSSAVKEYANRFIKW